MNFLHFKNSFRVLLKNKNYLLINVLGMGVGIASFLMLSLFIYNDLSYNEFNKNLQSIYRVREGEGLQTKGLVIPKMIEQIPEVKNGTRIFTWDGYRMSHGDVAFPENVHYVDTGFFSIFTFPFIEGDASNCIHEKFGVVISRKFAEKYFGKSSALGKKLQVKFDNTFLQVNGVVDIPENSSIKFDIVSSYETGESISPWIKGVHDWYNTFSDSYVMLHDGVDKDSIDNKLQDIVSAYFIPVGKNKTDLNLFPFKKQHAQYESKKSLIVILSLIAFAIIGIAIFNFINLSITSSLTRIKEIGLKKVIGASKSHLIRQVMTESLIVSFFGMILGCLICIVFLPSFNSLFETSLQFSLFENKLLLPALLGIWVVVGFVSGLIPSLFWIRTKLTESLKGNILKGNKSGIYRYSLIILQFTIAIVLVTATFAVQKQVNHMIDKDPKFDKENVIVAELDTWQYEDLSAASQKFKLIADELKSSPYVQSVSFSQNIPGIYHHNYNTFYPEESAEVERIRLRKAYVGRNYFKTFGIEFVNGAGFSDDLKSYKGSMVLNKAAMQKLGYKEASRQILRESSETGSPNELIGTIDDFSYQGVQLENEPLAHFFTENDNLSDWQYLSVRSKPGASLNVMKLLDEKWQETAPGTTVTHFFADEKINNHYKEYVKINKVFSWFALIAIALSCVGLFALSSYAITQRTKEVGVRKVNGARISEILAELNKDFIKWVAIAFVVACPVAWYAMSKWLENFAYKTNLSWWIFALAGVLALGIALLTVSWQSWRAATRNPVEALRYE